MFIIKRKLFIAIAVIPIAVVCGNVSASSTTSNTKATPIVDKVEQVLAKGQNHLPKLAKGQDNLPEKEGSKDKHCS